MFKYVNNSLSMVRFLTFSKILIAELGSQQMWVICILSFLLFSCNSKRNNSHLEIIKNDTKTTQPSPSLLLIVYEWESNYSFNINVCDTIVSYGYCDIQNYSPYDDYYEGNIIWNHSFAFKGITYPPVSKILDNKEVNKLNDIISTLEKTTFEDPYEFKDGNQIRIYLNRRLVASAYLSSLDESGFPYRYKEIISGILSLAPSSYPLYWW